jgi:hypothetical protein
LQSEVPSVNTNTADARRRERSMADNVRAPPGGNAIDSRDSGGNVLDDLCSRRRYLPTRVATLRYTARQRLGTLLLRSHRVEARERARRRSRLARLGRIDERWNDELVERHDGRFGERPDPKHAAAEVGHDNRNGLGKRSQGTSPRRAVDGPRNVDDHFARRRAELGVHRLCGDRGRPSERGNDEQEQKGRHDRGPG